MARFEKVVYESATGVKIILGEAGLYVNANDLRNYSWSYDTKNDTVTNLKRKVCTKKLPLIMAQDTSENGIELKNRLFEVMERDVLMETPGKIWVGDYYLRGYVVKSSVSDYNKSNRFFKDNITFVTEKNSGWVKEISKKFVPSSSEQTGGDYPFDYSFEYKNPLVSDSIYNTSLVPSDFELIIYGPVTNPTVYIGGHAYSVNKTVSDQEKMTINSREKTVKLTKVNGEEENAFMYRDISSYIFTKIAPKNNIVTISSDFNFMITLYDERSQPEWI